MIFAFTSVLVALALGPIQTLASPSLETRANGIDQTIYSNLERFAKYSSAAYQFICPRPVGNKLVKSFDVSGTQGYIARDDKQKEIIVAYRGTLSLVDAFIDLQIILTPLKTPNVANAGSSLVHTGFQFAYNVAASTVLSSVKSQLASYPGYSLVVTGHSLGGAVASIAAVSIQAAYPTVPLKLYTYGQPRVGNAAFAQFVEKQVGIDNIFRATHTFDGVPTVLLKSLGYRHFATEYWNYKDPGAAGNVKKCTGGDDPTCSDSIPSTFINPAHIVYFNQVMALNPLLCI